MVDKPTDEPAPLSDAAQDFLEDLREAYEATPGRKRARQLDKYGLHLDRPRASFIRAHPLYDERLADLLDSGNVHFPKDAPPKDHGPTQGSWKERMGRNDARLAAIHKDWERLIRAEDFESATREALGYPDKTRAAYEQAKQAAAQREAQTAAEAAEAERKARLARDATEGARRAEIQKANQARAAASRTTGRTASLSDATSTLLDDLDMAYEASPGRAKAKEIGTSADVEAARLSFIRAHPLYDQGLADLDASGDIFIPSGKSAKSHNLRARRHLRGRDDEVLSRIHKSWERFLRGEDFQAQAIDLQSERQERLEFEGRAARQRGREKRRVVAAEGSAARQRGREKRQVAAAAEIAAMREELARPRYDIMAETESPHPNKALWYSPDSLEATLARINHANIMSSAMVNLSDEALALQATGIDLSDPHMQRLLAEFRKQNPALGIDAPPSMAQRVRSWIAGLGGEEGAISFGGDKPDETERVRETLRRIIAGDELLESIHRVSPERAQRMLEGLEGVTGDPTAPSASSRARAREFLAANPDVTPGVSQTGFEERVRSWLAGLDPPPTQAVRQQAAPALPEPAEGAITWDPRQTAEENAKRLFTEDAMERVRLDTGDWNARNLLAYMDPKEFLGLARQFVGGAPTKPESIDAVRAALAAGKPITDVPLLSFDPTTGQVTGHEGRHRATVLSEEGVPRMPVRLIGESDRAVYFDEQTNPGAWGYAEELPPTLRGEPQDVFYGGALNPYSIETPYYTEGPLRGTLRPEYAGAWRQQAAGLGGGGGSISARPGLLLGPNYPLGRGHPGWDRAAYGEFGGAFNDPPGWIPGRAFRAVHQQAAAALPEPAGAAPPRLINALTGQPVPDMPGGRGPRRVGAPVPYYTEGPLRGADAKAPAPFRGDNVGDASRGLLSPARYASEVADGASGLALRRLLAAGLGEGLGAGLGYALAPDETTPMQHLRGVEGDVASALGLPQRSQMPIFSLAPDRAAAVEAVEGQVGARPAPEVHRARVGGAAYPDWGASPVTEEERRVYLDNLSNLGLPLPDWAAWDVRPSAPPAIEWEDPVEVDAGGGVTWRGKRRRKPDQPTIEELGGPYRQTQSRWGDVLQ